MQEIIKGYQFAGIDATTEYFSSSLYIAADNNARCHPGAFCPYQPRSIIVTVPGEIQRMNEHKTYKFVNDFFYFVVRPDESRGRSSLICCSGVSLDRFAPLTRGRHGLAVSPSMRGLQNTRNAISSLALSKGARPRFIRGKDCTGIAPPQESWYTDLMLIEDAPESFPDEIIRCGVTGLVGSIFRACRIPFEFTDPIPAPDELQRLLEEQCRIHAR